MMPSRVSGNSPVEVKGRRSHFDIMDVAPNHLETAGAAKAQAAGV